MPKEIGPECGGDGALNPHRRAAPRSAWMPRCLSVRALGRITGRHAHDIAQGSPVDALGKPFGSPALSQPLLLLGRRLHSWSRFPSCLAQKAQGERWNSTLLKPHELHMAFQPLPTRSEFSLSGSLSIRGSHSSFSTCTPEGLLRLVWNGVQGNNMLAPPSCPARGSPVSSHIGLSVPPEEILSQVHAEGH